MGIHLRQGIGQFFFITEKLNIAVVLFIAASSGWPRHHHSCSGEPPFPSFRSKLERSFPKSIIVDPRRRAQSTIKNFSSSTPSSLNPHRQFSFHSLGCDATQTRSSTLIWSRNLTRFSPHSNSTIRSTPPSLTQSSASWPLPASSPTRFRSHKSASHTKPFPYHYSHRCGASPPTCVPSTPLRPGLTQEKTHRVGKFRTSTWSHASSCKWERWGIDDMEEVDESIWAGFALMGRITEP